MKRPTAKRAAKDDSFEDFVLDQLSAMSDLRAKRMFGGCGLYRDETFFGILFDGRMYLRVTPESRERYEARGMQPFRPNAKQTLARYWQVPPEVLEDARELTRGAEEAAHEARRADDSLAKLKGR